jgi:hypothetical protein
VALTVAEWASAVRQNPEIRNDVKMPGRLRELAVSDCHFDNSASGITHNEYLHLRAVWYRYRGEHIDVFAKFLKNDDKTGYRGFISPASDERARRLMAHTSSYLKKYLEECHKKAGHVNYLHPSPDCGYFAMVRYWQVMATTHTKDIGTGTVKIIKPQAGATRGRPTTPPSQQTSNTAPGKISPDPHSPPKFETPPAKSYQPARGTAGNNPSADEAYVNTALLLLLQAVTHEFHDNLSGSLHWVPPRMAMHLSVPVLNRTTKKFEDELLLEARVDGYLCDGENDAGLGRPMAICEAKSGVRSSSQVPTERQEAAEMAAWICDSAPDEGLLQRSASGRRR